MIQDPQYLIWADSDKKYKREQQQIAKKVFHENKALRTEVKIRQKNIKEHYLTLWQLARMGISKTDIQTREKEGNLNVFYYDGTAMYSREQIGACM